MTKRICSYPGCGIYRSAHGWCRLHLQRIERNGTPELLPRRTFAERFWAKVDKSAGPDGCWLWTASKSTSGYGRFGITRSRCGQAHRVAWELTYGAKIPPALFACHRCDNPPCVNPAHIFLGTSSDNMQDAISKGRFTMHKAKLTELDVQLIRALKRDKRMKAVQIHELFPEIGYSALCMIIRGDVWKNVA